MPGFIRPQLAALKAKAPAGAQWIHEIKYDGYRAQVHRNEGWLKIKTSQRGKFPVIGFVKDPTGVAALYLGKREGKELIYMGIRPFRSSPAIRVSGAKQLRAGLSQSFHSRARAISLASRVRMPSDN
jgi:ATP-dependent DNA ligase